MGIVKPHIWDDAEQTLREFDVDTDTIEGFNPKCVTINTPGLTSYNVTDEDILFVDVGAIGNNIDINLPDSVDRTVADTCVPVTIKNTNNTNSPKVFAKPQVGESIDGVGNAEVRKLNALTIAPDGSDWWII